MFSDSSVAGFSLLLCVVMAVVALFCARWSFVTSQPDEWLIKVRDGKLSKAGIGISLWRHPGDLIARFSSTIQRVGFKVDALTQEHLHVLIEGFVLWSVSPADDGPFLAFRNLGVANLNSPPHDLTSKKHLLTKLQYHAFQEVFAAEVQRYTATVMLDELLLGQDKVVERVTQQLRRISVPLGIRIEQFQLLQAKPVDPELARALSTRYEEQSRENEAQIRLGTAERMKKRELDSATSLAREESNAHRDTQAYAAQVELELEQRRAELLDAQNHVKRQQLEHEGELKMEQLEIERKTKVRLQEIERESQLATDAAQQELTEARIRREDTEATAKRARMLAEAEAQRDAILAMNSAEEKRPQAVRDHELARLVTEKVAEALGSLPLKDARWLNIGNESPMASIAAAIGEIQNLFSRNSTPTRPSDGGNAA
jgi:hypothetical protein